MDKAGKFGNKWRVGCALLPKKSSRYLTEDILKLAEQSNVEVFLMDPSKSIEEQGPLHAIIHKLTSNKEWEQKVSEFRQKQPEVVILDRLEAIRPVQNRETMLNCLGDGITFCSKDHNQTIHVKAPKQTVADHRQTFVEVKNNIYNFAIKPPFLAKPLYSDGREGSHGLAVVHSFQALQSLLQKKGSTLSLPLVLQQFMEHGGVLFKIYVLGDQVMYMQRPSLKLQGPFSAHESQSGLTFIPRISCKPLNKKGGDDSRGDLSERRPPSWLVSQLGKLLRQKTGLQMFNVDLICADDQQQQHTTYHVVDINYFPGFDKLPDFERRFVKFVREMVEQRWYFCQDKGPLTQFPMIAPELEASD